MNFLAEISSNIPEIIRIIYGILLCCTLLLAIPHRKQFFVSEKWQGYIQSDPVGDKINSRFIVPVLFFVWLLLSFAIIFDYQTVFVSFINLILCRHFFVKLRWKSLLRGMGAPGFFTYWLAAAVFLLEYTLHYATSLRPLVLLALQIDFALIILSSGIYKYTAGYPKNEGMEYGLVNPEWGYWFNFYRKLPPGHFLFKTMNHLAWSTQIFSALLMLVPQTRLFGGLLTIFIFLFITTQIRLGFLCEMMMTGALLFFDQGYLSEKLTGTFFSDVFNNTESINTFPLLNSLLGFALMLYLVLLPLAHAGLFYNFYGRKSLVSPIQKLLELYTNFFGIIIWRVFSVDVVNFYLNVYFQNNNERKLISRYDKIGSRFNHVGESITITSIFTALKYYSSNNAIFRERLLRYAKTFNCPEHSLIVFEYISIVKKAGKFNFIRAVEYIVNPLTGEIDEVVLDNSVSVSVAHSASPINEGSRPGSYAPAKEK